MWKGTNLDAAKGLPHIYAPGEGVIKAFGDELFWNLQTGAGLTSRNPGTSNGRPRSLIQSRRLILSRNREALIPYIANASEMQPPPLLQALPPTISLANNTVPSASATPFWILKTSSSHLRSRAGRVRPASTLSGTGRFPTETRANGLHQRGKGGSCHARGTAAHADYLRHSALTSPPSRSRPRRPPLRPRARLVRPLLVFRVSAACPAAPT